MIEGALIVTEHERKFDPGAEFGGIHRIRKLEQGDAALSFYRRNYSRSVEAKE